MKISAIIPIFNGEPYLTDAVSSLINQTFPLYEIILVDDSSTDRSVEIAKSFSLRYPSVKVYKNDNEKGISGAVNTGIIKSSGDLIAFMDQDDVSLPDRILKQRRLLENDSSVTVCGTWMQEFGEGSDVWDYPTQDVDIKPLLLLHSPIANPTGMIRKNVFEKTGIYYRSAYDLAQDFDFWVRIFPYVKFAIIPEVLVNYRIHSKNSSKTESDMQFQAWKRAIKPLIDEFGVPFGDERYAVLYSFKYPYFKEIYKKNKRTVDLLINSFLEANKSKNIFNQKSLNKLFLKKVHEWTI